MICPNSGNWDGQNLPSFDILIRHDKRMNYELIIQISLKILKENTPFENYPLQKWFSKIKETLSKKKDTYYLVLCMDNGHPKISSIRIIPK